MVAGFLLGLLGVAKYTFTMNVLGLG
jgi:hypothetical protein